MQARIRLLLWLSCIVLCVGLVFAARSGKRLWVLQDTGEVEEFDPSTWAHLSSVKVPAEFLRDPDSLQINCSGRMLFCADPRIQFGNQEQHFPAGRVWVWNGTSATTFDRGAGQKPTLSGSKVTVDYD